MLRKNTGRNEKEFFFCFQLVQSLKALLDRFLILTNDRDLQALQAFIEINHVQQSYKVYGATLEC